MADGELREFSAERPWTRLVAGGKSEESEKEWGQEAASPALGEKPTIDTPKSTKLTT